jgi:hypothetical protein
VDREESAAIRGAVHGWRVSERAVCLQMNADIAAGYLTSRSLLALRVTLNGLLPTAKNFP